MVGEPGVGQVEIAADVQQDEIDRATKTRAGEIHFAPDLGAVKMHGGIRVARVEEPDILRDERVGDPRVVGDGGVAQIKLVGDDGPGDMHAMQMGVGGGGQQLLQKFTADLAKLGGRNAFSSATVSRSATSPFATWRLIHSSTRAGESNGPAATCAIDPLCAFSFLDFRGFELESRDNFEIVNHKS